MRSPSQHSFSQVPRVNVQRSTFNRSHSHKTTFDQGRLIPFYVDEVLPGDTFSLTAQLFGRLATPFVPFMDNLHLDLFYFFVPCRLVWEHWQNHMGENDDPSHIGTVDYETPTIRAPAGGFQTGSIPDYFGIPVGVADIEVSALPFRAYNLIWNEWFRSQDLQSKAPFTKGDGPDNIADYPVLTRTKRHDYFTSALPWPQKGPGVEIAIGGQAPIEGAITGTYPSFQPVQGVNSPIGAPAPLNVYESSPAIGGNQTGHGLTYGNNPNPSSGSNSYRLDWYDPGLDISGLYANLQGAKAVTINDLRRAFQIQRLYERDARSGSRYTEVLRSHFGVTSPDYRLQRPEYLGGTSSYINVTPIAQTSASGVGDTPQGNLAAMGTFSARGGFSKSFTEHGYVIGLLEVRADLSYSQGLHRMWTRKTRYDYYWPVLAHLGEQAIYNYEIFATGTEQDQEAWGYQERWAEYRYAPSKITGLMRHTPTTGAADSLDVWHLAQKFESLPTLSADFLNDATGTIKRVSAVQTGPDFLLDSLIQVKATRPMPTYSVPGLIDHL